MRDLRAARVAGFGTTIFTEMSALALQYNAANLGQGFPDFAGPAYVKQAVAAAVAADLNQYAPMPGLPRLRKAAAAEWQRVHGREIDWQSEVSITSGATEALCDAMLAFVNPGEHVVFFEPGYDAYVPDIIMAGAIPLPVRLYPPKQLGGVQPTGGTEADALCAPTAWSFDAAELRAAFARRPKLLLLNTPHNPTGKVFTQAELELIAGLCQEYDVLAITDEVYDRLVFGQAIHRSLAELPGMWERTLTLNSIGKTFSVTGWKIGWAIGPANLNQALRAAHQWVTFATSTPLQEASAVALEHAPTNGYYEQLLAEYAERRQLLIQVLGKAGLPQFVAEGSYFISCDISGLGTTNTREFCFSLVRERGVASIPISAFYSEPASAPPLVRFCFAKKLETIQLAGERLQGLMT
jgi:aspartate/methionine/tyrosine aminotransferase